MEEGAGGTFYGLHEGAGGSFYGRSRRKRLVHFVDDAIHDFTEQGVHFAEAALRIKRRVVEVFAFEVVGGDDVVADELEPGGLGVGEGLAGVLLENPVAVVAAHGFGEGGQFPIDAAGAADEGDEGGEFADGRGRGGQAVEPGVGVPDVERGKLRGVGLEQVEHFLDLREGEFLASPGLVVVDGQRDELVLVIAQPALEILLVLRRIGGAGVPAGAEQHVDGVVVDGLQVLFAGLDDVGDERAGERLDGGGDELLLGLFTGAVAGVGARGLAGEFEGALFDGLAVDGGEEVFGQGGERGSAGLFLELLFLGGG